jgi:hypothetical protein
VIDPVTSATAASPTAGASKTDAAATKGFEQMLLEQLTQEMLKTVTTSGPDDADSGDDGSGGGASGLGGAYASMLPGALADSIVQGGGLGL